MKLATQPLTLADYPGAIAQAQLDLRNADSHIIQLQETLLVLGVEIDKQVLADETLTNETKRKSRRLDLMQSDPDYSLEAARLKKAQEVKAELEIQLSFLLNNFSVQKLTLRQTIAQMELQAVSAA